MFLLFWQLYLVMQVVSFCSSTSFDGGVLPLSSIIWSFISKFNVKVDEHTHKVAWMNEQQLVGLCSQIFHVIDQFVSKGIIKYRPQLSNLWWIANSVSKGFDTAMKTCKSRLFKRYPTTSMCVQVDLYLLWIKAYPGLSYSSEKSSRLETQI